MPEVLHSQLDESRNFVFRGDYPGMIEARYVRRSADYFMVYLSSQTGCNRACRMCHLTQSGQTQFVDVPMEALLEQVDTVLDWYRLHSEVAQRVHINYMARGEVLGSAVVRQQADELIERINAKMTPLGLVPIHKFSTIMPQEMAELALSDVFKRNQPDIYYSVYSLDPAFRRRWLPKALSADEALRKLYDWQQTTHKIPKLHWAFIEGENDDEQTISGICAAVNQMGLRVNVNIVRYNPFSPGQGQEPVEEIIARNAALMEQMLPESRIQVVSRVGVDVKASCGMFVGGRQPKKQ